MKMNVATEAKIHELYARLKEMLDGLPSITEPKQCGQLQLIEAVGDDTFRATIGINDEKVEVRVKADGYPLAFDCVFYTVSDCWIVTPIRTNDSCENHTMGLAQKGDEIVDFAAKHLPQLNALILAYDDKYAGNKSIDVWAEKDCYMAVDVSNIRFTLNEDTGVYND